MLIPAVLPADDVHVVLVRAPEHVLNCENARGLGDCDAPLLESTNPGCTWTECEAFTTYAQELTLTAGRYRAEVTGGSFGYSNGTCSGGGTGQGCTSVKLIVPSLGVALTLGDASCKWVYNKPLVFESLDETAYFYLCDSDNNNNAGQLHIEVTRVETDPARDQDGDGQEAASLGGPDCNDGDLAVYAGAPELEDGKDNDCDGKVDAQEATPAPLTPSPTPAADAGGGCGCVSVVAADAPRGRWAATLVWMMWLVSTVRKRRRTLR